MAEGNDKSAAGGGSGGVKPTVDPNQVLNQPGAADKKPDAAAPADETPEQKTAREAAAAEALKNETPEQKTAREAADKKKADDEKAKAGAPEKYTDFTLPEGISVKPEDLAKFGELARSLNLSQEAAQKLVDFQAGFETERAKQSSEFWTKLTEDWGKACESDPEFGGEKFKASAAIANKFLDTFGNDALRQVLATYGLANNPELVRTFWKAGVAIGDDKLVAGGSSQSEAKVDVARTIFPSMKNI